MENEITALYFGLGFQAESNRTKMIQSHLKEMNAKGYKLLQSEKSLWSIPITWRFYWELTTIK